MDLYLRPGKENAKPIDYQGLLGNQQGYVRNVERGNHSILGPGFYDGLEALSLMPGGDGTGPNPDSRGPRDGSGKGQGNQRGRGKGRGRRKGRGQGQGQGTGGGKGGCNKP